MKCRGLCHSVFGAVVFSMAAAVLRAGVGGNLRPTTPVVTEPLVNGQVVNPADVHMETAPFSDPNPGDLHRCSDWEIWKGGPTERVWFKSCTAGQDSTHTHLGGGVFENSHAGRSDLLPNTAYGLRVRHRDDSGDPGTEWSSWSPRVFQTRSASSPAPLHIEDVLPVPSAALVNESGGDLLLGDGRLRLESAESDLLLEFRGQGGGPNLVVNPPALSEHADVRVRVMAGALPLNLPESRIRIVSDQCVTYTIVLPPIALNAGDGVIFWAASNGSTYEANESDTEPDFSNPARLTSTLWAVLQPGFEVEVFATGFRLPINIAFVPNPGPNPNSPLMYVTELYGTIKVVLRNGTVRDYATNLLNYDPSAAFPGSGQQGLTGIVVDSVSGDVFAGMLYDFDSNPQTTNDHYPKVVRFHSLDGGLTAASSNNVLNMVGERQGQDHQISNLSIGPDRKLYVHMGDGFNVATALDLNSFRGKILRANMNGSAPSDNPFYTSIDGISARDYIFAYGFRNPFGGAWREADFALYQVENGPSVDRFSKVVGGRNFAWNGTDASMMTLALYNWSPAHAPVNLAFIQNATFGGSGFPAGKLGHAFASEAGPTWASGPQPLGKRISEYVLDPEGDLVSGPIPLIEYAGTGKATVCALAAGPDGLYFSDLYKDRDFASATDRGANIWRVRAVAVADCNGNGRNDLCDIGSGTSADNNGNLIPDECDQCPDGDPCDDGDPCTVNERCSQGTCVGTPAVYGDVFPPGGDGVVGPADLFCVLAGYSDVAACPDGDIWPCAGGDGQIDISDILADLFALARVEVCPDPCP